MNTVNEGVILWDLEHLQISHFIAQTFEFSRSPCWHQKEKSLPTFWEDDPHHVPVAGMCNMAVQCACPWLPVQTSSLHSTRQAADWNKLPEVETEVVGGTTASSSSTDTW